jgi:hypothetical protein
VLQEYHIGQLTGIRCSRSATPFSAKFDFVSKVPTETVGLTHSMYYEWQINSTRVVIAT